MSKTNKETTMIQRIPITKARINSALIFPIRSSDTLEFRRCGSFDVNHCIALRNEGESWNALGVLNARHYSDPGLNHSLQCSGGVDGGAAGRFDKTAELCQDNMYNAEQMRTSCEG